MRNQQDQNKTVERHLVAKAKSGDHNAFGKLVEMYQKRLYYVIMRIVLNHEDTDDVLQDTFVKMYENLSLFDERRPLYPWLLTIATNQAINKRKWRRRKSENPIDDAVTGSVHNPGDLATEEEVEITELDSALWNAMDSLSVELRSVFVLRVQQELSYKEISKMLGISMGTVMSRLARAREKLRFILAPYLERHDVEVDS